MSFLKYISKIFIIIVLIPITFVMASEDKHWAYNELAAYKQLMLPVINNDLVSEADKDIIRREIFSEENLDKDIHIDYWALLLRETMRLNNKDKTKLLDIYVYGLATGEKIKREDAVGGMVKLLTLEHLSGQINNEDLKGAQALKDIGRISEIHSVLVQKAFAEGILDSTVNDSVRPNDILTVAEAISMLYRVMEKYNIDLNENVKNNGIKTMEQHWVNLEIDYILKAFPEKVTKLERIQNIIEESKEYDFNTYISIDKWNELLFYIYDSEHTKYDRSILEIYTYGMAKGKYITRNNAIAGMLKISGILGILELRDATDEEIANTTLRFKDYKDITDKSKVSQAVAIGLINGYEDNSLKPEQYITKGEAVAIIIRILKTKY